MGRETVNASDQISFGRTGKERKITCFSIAENSGSDKGRISEKRAPNVLMTTGLVAGNVLTLSPKQWKKQSVYHFSLEPKEVF